MTGERMAWWRRSAELLVEAGFRQGTSGDGPVECSACAKRISGNRIWRRQAAGEELCRRCAVERQVPPAKPPRPELRPLLLAILELLEDGWSDPIAIRSEASRRLRCRRRVPTAAWSPAWSAAKQEFDRRCERRIHKPYDGSSRFGWQPGR